MLQEYVFIFDMQGVNIWDAKRMSFHIWHAPVWCRVTGHYDLLNKLIQNTNLNVFSKRVSDKNLSFTSREIFAGKFEMKSDHKVHFDSPLN